jgi:hypothetical protein
VLYDINVLSGIIRLCIIMIQTDTEEFSVLKISDMHDLAVPSISRDIKNCRRLLWLTVANTAGGFYD